MINLKKVVTVNHSPCFIPSPPMEVAFSLVRKVQGQKLSVAGEAPMGLTRNGISSPVNTTTPASPTRQTSVGRSIVYEILLGLGFIPLIFPAIGMLVIAFDSFLKYGNFVSYLWVVFAIFGFGMLAFIGEKHGSA